MAGFVLHDCLFFLDLLQPESVPPVHRVADSVFSLGGWQEQVTYPHHAQNLLLFYQMLRQNGFHQDHIKTFFANEGQGSGTGGGRL